MAVVDNAARTDGRLTVRPLAAAMGAELVGEQLADLDDDAFAELEQALGRHGMLFARGQRMDHAAHDAFTRRFGEHGVDAYTDGVDGFRDIQPVIREPGPDRGLFFGALWHTDSPFLARPPKISILRSVEVPPWGGDTWFANSRLAYDRLSPAMAELVAPLVGLYTRSHLTRARAQWEAEPSRPFDVAKVETDLSGATAHPIVRTHPVTGDRALYVDVTYTVGFDGFTRAEAAPILDFLTAHLTQPLFTCRLRWENDMIALWDNRLVVHQAFDDYGGARREMYRSTVLGEEPA